MGERRPLILVSPRWETKVATVQVPEPRAPEETVANVFLEAILAAGGLPLTMAITDDASAIEAYLEMADGVAVPGGHDVDPALWGAERCVPEEALCPVRDAFELALLRRAVELDKPVLATCRGAQILNVALGGTLCMDVSSLAPREGMALWRHEMVLHDAAHPVEVEEGSRLCEALGGATLVQTNSSHHCCVGRPGEGVRVVAHATDGVPEGIEVASARFCVGVQWHPEYTWRSIETDRLLWRSFVAACATPPAGSAPGHE